jgi:WD40 repeat protein
LEHFDTIQNSPSQLYHFALPFSPSSSWLCKYYTAEVLQVPKVIKGANARWGTCSRTVVLDQCPLTLSYWNNTIAVGYQDKNIIILDATTGSQAAVLSGHTNWVRSVTFSSDGRSLVSGGDDTTIKLWDMQTGGVVKTFHGHRHSVNSVSISVDCSRIVSGSPELADEPIRLWDIQTGECYCTIKRQAHHVSFSPINPQHIIFVCH